ncbi:MAG: VP4 [Gokushovirus NL-1994]|nr:MAG: VP4 [Gokushovirus NL-1994]
MSCYHPIDCWRVPDSSAPSGHRIVFGSPGAPPERGAEPTTIPCGKCIGCRLAHSRAWAVRCVHESTLHEHNCFLTLTFDDDHLPSDHSVHVRDVQLFLKRLRKSLRDTKVRFFACGEYGEKNARPHYHLIVFGYDFGDDRILLRQTPYGPLYISDHLFRLWPFGYHTIGNVTFKSCAYVARYVTKKVYGKDAPAHYAGRNPEFITMSRKPGIAHDWITKYSDDVYNYDKVVMPDGTVLRPPRYYDDFLHLTDEERFDIIRLKRKASVKSVPIGRLLDLEQHKLEVTKKLIRPIE